MHNKLNHIHDIQLKRGLEILLSEEPEDRKQIYRYWGIICDKNYYLNSPLSASVFKESNVHVVTSSPYRQYNNSQFPNFKTSIIPVSKP